MNIPVTVILGTTTLCLAATLAFAEATPECTKVACVYKPLASAESPEPELAPFPDCACIKPNGEFSIDAQHLGNLNFDVDGLAAIRVARGRVAFVRRDGKSAWSHPFENGADYFVEGLARTVDGTKIGFINKNLDVVIESIWDFAFPFEDGLALVCERCRSVSADTGEHLEIEGGRWGYIDKRGKVVVSVSYTRDQLPARPAVLPSD